LALQRDDAVLAFVLSEIERNPAISGTELYESAKRISPAVEAMNRRQFHAGYVLQARKRKDTPSRERRSRPVSPSKRQIRGIRHLLEAHIDERKRAVADGIASVQMKAVSEGDLLTLEALDRELSKIAASLKKLRTRA
jgi:hypothetical protein